MEQKPRPDIFMLKKKSKKKVKSFWQYFTVLLSAVTFAVFILKAEPALGKFSDLYRLGPGDVVEISMYGYEKSVQEVLVDPNGYISYLLVGQIKASGKTVPQLREEIMRKLAGFFRDPLVSIIPMQFNSRAFTIMGAVNNPGTFEIKGFTKILDALGIAKGFAIGVFNDSTVEISDLEHAFLVRKNQYIPVNFVGLIKEGDFKENILLQAGDYIYIPSSVSNEIFLLGEIQFPGSYGFADNMTLLKTIIEGGGFSEEANKRKVLVVRGSLTDPQVYRINLTKVLLAKEKDFFLEPKDIIYVPKKGILSATGLIEKAITSFVTTVSGVEAEKVFKRTVGDRKEANEVEFIQVQ